MGKFLKVVVIILFLASAAAAVLAYMNYGKRQMLAGRTEKLEKAVESLAATFDEKDPVFEGISDHPAKDIEDVTAREVASPETSRFWESYNDALESIDAEKLNIKGRSINDPKTGMRIPQIKQFYALDENGKPKQSYDGYETEGKGTMAELLEEVQERASAQSKTLNLTRAELKKVREELETTIRELNEQKKLRRQNLAKIAELEDKIAKLESEKAELQAKVQRLETKNSQLTDQVNTLQQELADKQEELDAMQKKYEDLEKKHKELLRGFPTDAGPSGTAVAVDGKNAAGRSTPGVKGTVVKADANFPFVVIKLDQAAVEELTIKNEDGSVVTRPEEYMVRRNGFDSPAGTLISRVRIQSIKRDSNLAIADELVDWQQSPIQIGDEVFF